MSKKIEVSSLIAIIWPMSCNEGLFGRIILTLQEPRSRFWYHAVMSLQLTHVRSFAQGAGCMTRYMASVCPVYGKKLKMVMFLAIQFFDTYAFLI